ncbi:MAG TPA: histidine kinase [Candidatus Limnocylindria bacterium]|nr:histidine kinase [Candidatus Limnocylindria bacterium]
MHPLLAGRLRPALYLGVWLGIGTMLTSLMMLLEPRPLRDAVTFAGPLVLTYAFVCLSAWWVCRAHPLGTTPPLRLLASLLGAALLASAVWVGAGALWAILLERTAVDPGRAGVLRDLGLLFTAGIILYAESIVIHYFLLAFESARTAERRAFESQVSARDAELRALRAQLNPHFLFNSLNSISALTGPDPEAARRMCQLLGDFLRTSLSLGAREQVAFADELALAERYLSIEQVRFGARLGFEKHIDPDAERCLVPPLLIQPLIENAVKHGVADRVDGGVVKIEARRRGPALEVTVENPRDPEAPQRRGHGVGLENVRRRLQALDPRGTRVDVFRETERFRVVLTLPAVENVNGADDGRP